MFYQKVVESMQINIAKN